MAEINANTATRIAPPLRALLSDIIDYAGIFPPASLSLAEAVENYASYLRSDESWMLARFIIPAGRLRDFEAHAHHVRRDSTLRFSVLPTGGNTGDDFLDAFEFDLDELQQFLRDHPGAVDQLELKLPREFLDTDVVHVRRFLNSIDDVLKRFDHQHLDFFVEIPLNEFLRQSLPILTGALTVFNRDRSGPDVGRGCVKMRTGGTEPDAIPSIEDVAYVITACRGAAVPFKATAGLHHPMRHYDDGLGAHTHGFLNLFCAAAIAFANDLDEEQTAIILQDEDPSHFTFGSDALSWTHLSAPLHDVERVRATRALSFGSCSFDEPVADLRALGHL